MKKKKRVRKCPHCGYSFYPDSSERAAFCPENPRREQNLAAWRRGDKRFRDRRPRHKRLVRLTAVVVPPSPFNSKKRSV